MVHNRNFHFFYVCVIFVVYIAMVSVSQSTSIIC
jgi:hypothetical protein